MRLGRLLALVCQVSVAAACDRAERPVGESRVAAAEPGVTAAVGDSAFIAAPESAWVNVAGPTLVAFYPIASNDSLEADEDLAAALDDLSFHIGTAMDSLIAAGFRVEYRAGDTLWLRTGALRARVARHPDSASVGYVFADSLGRRTVIYGVRTHLDLVEYAHEFQRTGRVRRTPD